MRNRNIYPVMPIFRRNRSGGGGGGVGGGGGGDPTTNEKGIYNDLMAAISTIAEGIQLVNNANEYNSKFVDIRPYKLCYIRNGSLTNRDLYCIFEYTFPANVASGDGFMAAELSQFSVFGGYTSVGSTIPHVYGKIGIYDKPGGASAPFTFSIASESAGEVVYANFDESLIVEEDWEILFPSTIPGTVLAQILPQDTYATAFGGILYGIQAMLERIPENIRPYNFLYFQPSPPRLQVRNWLDPAYGAGKSIKIRRMERLITPTIV